MIDIANEIKFQTSRSGGKGGQNVNKVETSVEGYFQIGESRILNDDQKALVLEKLSNRINNEGFLQVRSQIHRTQLANKEEVIEKMNDLITNSLKKQKKRIATKPSWSSKQKRSESKIRQAEKKQGRQKYRM